MRYKNKPKTIEAIQWTGDNTQEVSEFTEGGFNTEGIEITNGYDQIVSENVWAEVYNESQKSFNNVNLGDYIIRGTQGEYYPCEENIFKASYDPDDELGLLEGDDLIK